jgi:hypothetical protein
VLPDHHNSGPEWKISAELNENTGTKSVPVFCLYWKSSEGTTAILKAGIAWKNYTKALEEPSLLGASIAPPDNACLR